MSLIRWDVWLSPHNYAISFLATYTIIYFKLHLYLFFLNQINTFHVKQWFNVSDEKRIVNEKALQNFYLEQFGLHEEPENTQVQTRIHMDLDNRIGGQNTNETRNEPEFTSDEFKEHLAKLSLRKAPGTNGIRPELIVYGGERLHTLLLKLFNKCWMGKQNIPQA